MLYHNDALTTAGPYTHEAVFYDETVIRTGYGRHRVIRPVSGALPGAAHRHRPVSAAERHADRSRGLSPDHSDRGVAHHGDCTRRGLPAPPRGIGCGARRGG